MTANQRRPGFRLPWSSETDEPAAEGESAMPAAEASSTTDSKAAKPDPVSPTDSEPAPAAVEPGDDAPVTAAAKPDQAEKTAADAQPSAEPVAEPDATAASPAAATPAPSAMPEPSATPEPAAPAQPEVADHFMHDLVVAMRHVAEEARNTGVTELRARASEQVAVLETEATRRQEELRARAEADVAGVGEWAKAEAERIKNEAEQRVVARHAALEQQLAGDAARTSAETKALRDQVAEYERELDAYHAQLAEINDPAAFAAAAKRMPKPPELAKGPTPAPATGVAPADGPVEPDTTASNGVATPVPDVHPAEEEVLAARLAELDAALPDETPGSSTEPVTTEIVVKGLGSFGAITGFRQAMSALDGIEGVALSLGQTGEFVFRATHRAGFDLRAAIVALEGDGATVEDRPEGGLRVTLQRAR